MSDFSQAPQQRDFFCNHCNGRIIIPFDLPATTGPCPHCQGTITSPPPEPARPVATPPSQPEPEERISAPNHTAPAPIPERRDAAAPVTAQTPPPSRPAPAAEEKKKSSVIIPAMLGLLFLIIAASAAVYYISKKMSTPESPPTFAGSLEDQEIRDANFIRIGWQKEAFEVFDGFLKAKSVENKLPYVNNGPSLRTKMEDFYGGTVILDSDTPAESFSVHELSLEDRKRGLFMLTYDQPPQFALKDFFRPLATLEVQYGVDEADILLSTLARVGNFAMEPVRVHAFFKKTDEGLKLDWEIFAQTKYRLFQNYVELPDLSRAETFRVLIVEDVPERGQGVQGTRTYRLTDPANMTDTARINVKVDSEVGRTLSVINWRGNKKTNPITRTATVELEWTGQRDSPVLEIKRFICWEFLGLGGKEAPVAASSQ